MRYGGPIVNGADCMGVNLDATLRALGPKIQLALYATGGGGIAATPQQFEQHPGALAIDQDALARDPAADYLDVENGAATPTESPLWVRLAREDYIAKRRAEQRWPSVYVDQSNLTDVADALKSAGVSFQVGVVLANWSLSRSFAEHLILTAGGPYPIVGVQIGDPGPYDLDLYSGAWLLDTAGRRRPPEWSGTGKLAVEVDLTDGAVRGIHPPGAPHPSYHGRGKVAASFDLDSDHWEGIKL